MSKMDKLRILHVASFHGNIGDLINHAGFYDNMRSYFKVEPEINELEMRHFYRNERMYAFDLSFAEKANQYDVLILGGGGFFDVRHNDSATGTTIDISKEVIDRIKVPVIVNAMGYPEYEGDYQEAKKRFGEFLQYVLNKQNWFVSFRNDGSVSRIIRSIGKSITEDQLMKVPDNGFFFPKTNDLNIRSERKIGFCISNDDFSKKFNGDITEEVFNKQISTEIKRIINRGYKIVFFLHTPQDITTLSILEHYIGAKDFRYNVEIAPYDPNGSEAPYELERYYRKCDLIVGMRFHSNILALQNRIPTIGLAGHEQIKALFDEIGLSDNCIPVQGYSYIDKLDLKIIDYLDNPAICITAIDAALTRIREQGKNYYHHISSFISTFYPEKINA